MYSDCLWSDFFGILILFFCLLIIFLGSTFHSFISFILRAGGCYETVVAFELVMVFIRETVHLKIIEVNVILNIIYLKYYSVT